MEWLVGVLVLAAVGFVVIAATVSEWRDSGPFRALTYWAFLPVWAIHDHAKEFGTEKTIKGHSKKEFEELMASRKKQS